MKPIAEEGTNGRKLDAKDRILKAGTVFSRKGYSETTISDVAREARVSNASVYQHFSGKEELFVAVSSQRIRGGADLMEEQLFGIKSAFARLRKFVWFYVRSLTEDREVTKEILLYLKTSKTLLETEAYRGVQKLYGKITEILESGQKSGEIKADINVYTARVTLIGSMEHLLIRWLGGAARTTSGPTSRKPTNSSRAHCGKHRSCRSTCLTKAPERSLCYRK